MPRMGKDTFVRVRLTGGGGSYLLLPSLTTTQRDALAPETGLLIWNTTTAQIEQYNGSAWAAVGGGAGIYLPLAGGTMSGNIAMAGAQTVDGVDVSAHAANLAAHLDSVLRQYIVGTYFRVFPPSASSNASCIANELDANPFVVARPLTIDRLAIEVYSADTGKSVRLGVYADSGSVYPGALLVDGGAVSVGTTGIKTVTISLALTRGLYWLAIISEGVPILRAESCAVTPLGADPLHLQASYYESNYYVTQSYGALPTTFPAGAEKYLEAYIIMPRLASLD